MTYDKICNIDFGGKPFGILKWGREGLKIVFRAESFVLADGIYRIYAFSSKNPEKKLLIGVPEPENGILSLTRGLSDYDFNINGLRPEEIDLAEAVLSGAAPNEERRDFRAAGDWALSDAGSVGLRDEIVLRSIGVRQVLYKKTDGRVFIAEPFHCREELMTAPAIALATFGKISGEWHAIYEVKNGFLAKTSDIDLLAE